MADNRINITLRSGAGDVDLNIPTKISVYQLMVELIEIYPGLASRMRRYQVKVPTKDLLLTEEDIIAHFPITMGDVIQVVEDEQRD